MLPRVLAIVILSSAALGAACGGGGGGDDDDAPENTIDASTQFNVLANRMTLGSEDFPDDWSHREFTEEFDEDPFDVCETGDPTAITGRAETGYLYPGVQADTHFSEHVMVFDTPEHAREGITDIEERRSCVVDTITDGGLDDARSTYSDPMDEDLEVLPFGDGVAAFRVTAHVELSEGFVPEAEIYMDFVYVTLRGAGILLFARNAFEPYPTELLEDVTQVALEKAADALGLEVDDPRPNRPSAIENAAGAGAEETDEPEVDETGEATQEPTPDVDVTIGDIVPFGDPATALDRLQVRVLTVNFDADDVVAAANQFNDPAAAGKHMLMATVEVTNVGSTPLDAFFDPTFTIIGAAGEVYEQFGPSCGVIPDELEGELDPGQSAQGNICLQVADDDTNFILGTRVFADDLSDEETVYLALE